MKYFLLFFILIFSCTPSEPIEVQGCLDNTACNHNPEANEDDGSCVYEPDMCGTCDNDPSNDCVEDCTGTLGGNTLDSVCAACFSNEGTYDCDGNCCIDNLIYDIEFSFQTSESCLEMDNCEICDSDPENDCSQDCTGVWGGSHQADDIGFTIIQYGNQEYERYCGDLYVLQQFLDANDFSITQSAQNETAFHSWDLNLDGVIDLVEFGEQEWEDGRLIYLKVDIPIIITADIGNLVELKELILETSGLTAIPETIGNLHNLEFLTITSNPIDLFPESISDLTNLEELIISNNNLSNLPENIGNLANLRRLEASTNQLDMVPNSIGSLNNLNYLFLEDNQINILPNTFGNLSNLIELRLQKNQLEELPESFGVFGALLQLSLNDNQLSTLPDNLGGMSSLKNLRLNDNNLVSIPTSIGSLENLEEFWLQRNQIVTLPDEIGELNSIIKLFINYNLLDSIPESIGNLESLQELTLDNNTLIKLPESLCDQQNDGTFIDGLVSFSVNNNKICSGSYPICLEEMVNSGSQECEGCPPHYFFINGYCAYESDYNILQNFLDLNSESQSLPANTGIPYDASECVNTDWWNGGKLVEITFQHKELTSIIPDNFGELDKLEILRLTGNELAGEIPDEIINLENLKILKLNSNNLSGNIPENIGSLSNIDTLWLTDNNLTGEIPASITNLSELQYLGLEENNLDGVIPENIGAMDSLKYLYIDNNHLFGEIPQNIGNLSNLRRLYLYNNYITGQVPESMCTIYSINENFQLRLHNNQLCPGSIGYPTCIPENHIGLQDTIGCSNK